MDWGANGTGEPTGFVTLALVAASRSAPERGGALPAVIALAGLAAIARSGQVR
jgi:hypothetical protein